MSVPFQKFSHTKQLRSMSTYALHKHFNQVEEDEKQPGACPHLLNARVSILNNHDTFTATTTNYQVNTPIIPEVFSASYLSSPNVNLNQLNFIHTG